MMCNVMSAQERDSLIVYFTGHVPKREKFKVQYGADVILKFKSNGGYKHKFKVPLSKNAKNGDALNIYVLRKGLFGLSYKDVGLNRHFELGYKYLIIFRDNRLKNKYAVDSEWSNKEPNVHHLVQ